MHSFFRGGIRIATLSAALCFSLNAAVIFNNGLPDQTGSTDLTANLAADDFTLNGDFNINLIRYWTVQTNSGAYTGPTQWSVRSNAAGTPGSILFQGSFTATQAATGNNTFGTPEFVHTGSVNFNLGAGSYWLVLSNPASSPEIMSWAFANGSQGNAQAFEIGVGPWGSIDAELAFQLEGEAVGGGGNDIPEPGTVVLMGAGLIALAASRTRRKA